MKLITLTLLGLLNTSCTYMADTITEENSKPLAINNTVSDELAQAILLAKENKDYRLMITSGRNMSIPGVDANDYQAMISLCGKKYNPSAGDVLTSEEQRQARKKIISFMRQYNEQMVIICQEQNNL